MIENGVSYLRSVILKDGFHLRYRVANNDPDSGTGPESVSCYRVYITTDSVNYICLDEVANNINDILISSIVYTTLSCNVLFKIATVGPDGTEYFTSSPHLPKSSAVMWTKDYLPLGNKTKYPPWFNTLTDHEKNDLLKQKWFVNWMQTTTSLWPNITKIKQDNPDMDYDIIWRTDSDVLFHGDEEGRRPDEVFCFGLTPPEPMGNMKLRPGSHVGIHESFSRLFDGLPAFAECDSMKLTYSVYDERYIYLTNAPGGICVDDTLHIPTCSSESEVAFPGGVKQKYIMGAFVYMIPPSEDQYLPVRFDYNPESDFKEPTSGNANYITARTDDNEFSVYDETTSNWITLNAPVCTMKSGKYKVRSKNIYTQYFVNFQQVEATDEGIFEIDTEKMAVDGVIILSGHNYFLSI